VVKREENNPHDSDSEPAYAIMVSGSRIGYIPSVVTVKGKQIEAKREGNHGEWQRRFDEVNTLVYLRDCIYVDLERNHIIPEGKIASVRWMDDNGRWNSEGDGELLGISVSFDYN